MSLSGSSPVGIHPIVCRFLKGVFINRPSLPRYTVTWNVDSVLAFLETLMPLASLDLGVLTRKLVMLLALVTAQRVQFLHLLEIGGISFTSDQMTLYVDKVLKTTRPGHHQVPIHIPKFTTKLPLCVYSTMLKYLNRTDLIRQGVTQLFIGTVLPHGPVCRSTISRWIKTVLSQAGIDVSVFGAHSTRAAATSAASSRGVPIPQIMKAAGWSRDSTFFRFYNRHVDVTSDSPNANTSLSELLH